MKKFGLLLSMAFLSSCAIANTLEAVNNINLAECIDECSETEVDGCLDEVGTDDTCFMDLEACFDVASTCSDYCLDCEEEGGCEDEDACQSDCNAVANGCTDIINDCAEGLVDEAQDAIVDACIKPLVACVAICIEDVEDSLSQ